MAPGRDETFRALQGSPVALALAGGGLLLALVGWIVSAQVSKIERKAELAEAARGEFLQHLKDQVAGLVGRLELSERGHTQCLETVRLNGLVISRLEDRLIRAERILRDNGLQLDESRK